MNREKKVEIKRCECATSKEVNNLLFVNSISRHSLFIS